jgi:hypothetical protein
MAVIHPRSHGKLCANGTRAGSHGRGASGRPGYAEIAARTRAAFTASESVAMS